MVTSGNERAIALSGSAATACFLCTFIVGAQASILVTISFSLGLAASGLLGLLVNPLPISSPPGQGRPLAALDRSALSPTPLTSARPAKSAVVLTEDADDGGNAAFTNAVAGAKTLKGLSNQDILSLYAHYKQSTVGDAPETSTASRMDIKGRYKWENWSKLRGTSCERAKRQYVQLVHDLQAKSTST
jgi:diazepam-binding inhibitor (GABA receptor modulating acyl-CoA-binding protein)